MGEAARDLSLEEITDSEEHTSTSKFQPKVIQGGKSDDDTSSNEPQTEVAGDGKISGYAPNNKPLLEVVGGSKGTDYTSSSKSKLEVITGSKRGSYVSATSKPQLKALPGGKTGDYTSGSKPQLRVLKGGKNSDYLAEIKGAIGGVRDSYQDDSTEVNPENSYDQTSHIDWGQPTASVDHSELWHSTDNVTSTSTSQYEESDSSMPEEQERIVMTASEMKEEAKAEANAAAFNDSTSIDYRQSERLKYSIMVDPSLFWLVESTLSVRTQEVNYGRPPGQP